MNTVNFDLLPNKINYPQTIINPPPEHTIIKTKLQFRIIWGYFENS